MVYEGLFKEKKLCTHPAFFFFYLSFLVEPCISKVTKDLMEIDPCGSLCIT
jgi:hypothetical protein